MGGHGALTIYLKNLSAYRSASGFSPISHPAKAPWGEKAFNGYLKNGVEEGSKSYDATLLLKETGKKSEVQILVDCGTGDDFYKQGQLLPEDFAKAAMAAGYETEQINVRLQEGYDLSCE